VDGKTWTEKKTMKVKMMMAAIAYHKSVNPRPLRIKDMYLPDGSHYAELMENIGNGWRIVFYQGDPVEGFASREEMDILRQMIIEVKDEKTAQRKRVAAVS